ncbi:hypothetical protein HX275_002056 [Salmonella enterica]|nr:hypothetical protein [Salmonella enterica]
MAQQPDPANEPVFPAPAGINRGSTGSLPASWSIPRASGDKPATSYM